MPPEISTAQHQAWAEMAEFANFSPYTPEYLERAWSEGQGPSGEGDRRLCDYWLRHRDAGQRPTPPLLSEEGRSAFLEESRDRYQYARSRIDERGESPQNLQKEDWFLLDVSNAAKKLGSRVAEYEGNSFVARQALRVEYTERYYRLRAVP